MNQWLIKVVAGAGLSPERATTVANLVEIVLIALAAGVSYFLTKRVLLVATRRITQATQTKWDDLLVERGVFNRASHLLPALTIYLLAPAGFATPALVEWAQRGAGIYAVAAALATVTLLLTVGNEIYDGFAIARKFPIRVYVQVAKILVAAGALIVSASILTDQSPLLLLSGLGAMTAVLLLISKDSIQSLLAGIQLISNDMVRAGDWIEMPQYGADGDVLEIRLHTVKVRNWDNTITTIPPYAMISNSFKNWRGMAESGGRRIKRSVLIDVSTVRFCTDEMLERYRQIALVRDCVKGARGAPEGENSDRGAVQAPSGGGERLTNLGVFRRYVVAYLRAHPQINQDLTLMVRQLQPTDRGVPLELYAFSADKRWAVYEDIQSDIFDHIFACLQEFDLRAFQTPSGHNLVEAIQRARVRPVRPGAAK